MLGMLLLVEAMGVILTVAGSGALSAFFMNSMVAVQSQFRAVREVFQREVRSHSSPACRACRCAPCDVQC